MKIRVTHEVDWEIEHVISEILMINYLITTDEYSHLKYEHIKISKKRVMSDVRKLCTPFRYDGTSWISSLSSTKEEREKFKVDEIIAEAKRLSAKLFPESY